VRLPLALAATLVAAPARADLNFVQVTQAQTSAGAEGLFGKTWVELRGARMRLVSGYARKLETKGQAPDPRRRIQILDVEDGTRTSVDPAKRAYAVSGLGPPDYGHGLEGALGRGEAARRIVRHEVRLEKAGGTRKLLGADCERWRVSVTMRLTALNGREEAARMEQNLWVAPLSGDLAKNLMELIAFENAYRSGTKGALSPLDHERYQVREAAAYLQVPEAQLAEVIGTVREKLRELPSYPVSSSVAWWRDEGRAVRAPEAAKPAPGKSLGEVRPRPVQPPKPVSPKPLLFTRRPRPAFKVIDWRKEERSIDGMMEDTRSEFGDFPLGGLNGPRVVPRAGERPPRRRPLPGRQVAPRFEEELNRILSELVAAEAALEAAADQAVTSAPFFEIFAELHGLETAASVAESHFTLPPNYKKVSSLADAKQP
jgi:hypothetical protein